MASVKQVITDYLRKTYNVTLATEWVIFGIRGATPDGDGDLMENTQVFNKYDDTIGIINSEERKVYIATVEPGKKYTVSPMNPNGAFYLKNGLYQVVRAKHFGNDAFNIFAKYPKGAVEGYRDISRKGKPDKSRIFTDGTGIDIHAGGESLDDIGGWSAGCQVLYKTWKSKEWIEFRDTLYKSRQKTFLYCLLDYSEIKEEYEK